MIAFSGFDYSGKSTQIELLKDGHEFHIVWSRFGYTPSILYFKALLKKILSAKADVKIKAISTSSSKEYKSILDIWFWSAFIDYFFFGIYLHYLNHKYKKLVLDRYVLDALVDITIRYGQNNWRCRAVKILYDLIFPKPDSYIYLDIDLDTASTRRRGKKDPYPVCDEELMEIKTIYLLILSDIFNDQVNIIDASGEPHEVFKKITSIINIA